MATNRKRANDSALDQGRSKRPRTHIEEAMTDSATDRTPDTETRDKSLAEQDAAPATNQQEVQHTQRAQKSVTATTSSSKPRYTIRKLVPPRPFPTVPASVSATGPRSAHTEGKNYICISRKTQLGAYLRRCKDVIMKDGYKTLHLSAMGAAIPHLMQLVLSLPGILPIAPDEIRTEVLTGTIQVQDEVIPEDEDEDITLQVRGKSTVSVVIMIGDGVDGHTGRGKARTRGKQAQSTVVAAGGHAGASSAAGRKSRPIVTAVRGSVANQGTSSS